MTEHQQEKKYFNNFLRFVLKSLKSNENCSVDHRVVEEKSQRNNVQSQQKKS